MKYLLILLITTLSLQASVKTEIEVYYQNNVKQILQEQQILLQSLQDHKKPSIKLINKYGLNHIKFSKKNIIKRAQPIPKKIMLAQAYLESNNGNSRFAKEGYNYFGIWTYDKKKAGFIPKNREKGKTHRVQKFFSIEEAIDRYTELLNSVVFYKKFRSIREKILINNHYNYKFTDKEIFQMCDGLSKYSEDKNYVEKIKWIIKERKYDD